MIDFLKKWWAAVFAGAAITTGVIVSTTSDDDAKTSAPETEQVTQVSKTVLGVNGQISANAVTFIDPNFLKALDSLHPRGMRIPGGTYAKSYRWRQDIPTLDDLRSLAKATPYAHKFIVLNMITETLNSQLEFLDSLKAMGFYKDSVTLELSNESNSGIYSEELVKYGNVENYAKECAKWIAAIKQHQPNVKFDFGIPGGNKTGKYFRNYNEQIIKFNPDVYLIFHFHCPRYYVFNGVVDTALVSHLIDSVKKAMFGDFPWARIKVTEFNLRNEDHDEDIFFKDDFQHGLAASHMMKHFYQVGAAAALFHNVCGAEGNGAIYSTKKESWLSPTGKALRAFIQSKN